LLGLPGNPVSAHVCGFLFLAPLVIREPFAPPAPAGSVCRIVKLDR
jgi:molybdopterin biosynthesis enzyme